MSESSSRELTGVRLAWRSDRKGERSGAPPIQSIVLPSKLNNSITWMVSEGVLSARNLDAGVVGPHAEGMQVVVYRRKVVDVQDDCLSRIHDASLFSLIYSTINARL